MECQLPITGLSGHLTLLKIKSDNKGLCQIKSLCPEIKVSVTLCPENKISVTREVEDCWV